MRFEAFLKLDYELSNRLRVAEEPGLLRNITVFLGHSGDSWFWLIGLFVLWLVGDDYWEVRALVMVIAIILTATFVLIIKFTIRRQRPEGVLGQIYRKTDPHSFPSGHAARALMLGVIAIYLGPTWLGVVLLVWGLLVGLARVAMGVHFVSDIFAGWTLGVFTGVLVPNIIKSIL